MARYDGIADCYDREFPTTAPLAEPLEASIRLLGTPSGRLLDLGCGTGAQTVAFRDAGSDVSGIYPFVVALHRHR